MSKTTSNYVKLASDAGDQYLASLSEIQGNVLKSTSAFAARVPATSIEMPAAFAGVFPTAQEVTEASFAFAQKLLKQQQDFTEKFLAASTPAAK